MKRAGSATARLVRVSPDSPRDGVAEESLGGARALRIAWLSWLAVLAVVGALALGGHRRSVVPTYREAARAWLDGKPLYTADGTGFLYLPQSALLHVPLAILPPRIGEFLWRVVALGLFVGGLHRFARLAGRRAGCDFFPLVTLIALPLAWDSARNGQATLPLAGLLLLAVVDLAEERWTRSALSLVFGLAVKPLALVLILVTMVWERPMRWRLAAGMAAVLVAPFLTQRFGYVTSQYVDCAQSFRATAHVGSVGLWAQPFSALRVVGVHIDENWQTGLRAAAAVATLLLCGMAKRQLTAARYAVFLFALTASYLILFNPRTENNSYALLAPAIGVFFAAAVLVERSRGAAWFLLVLALGAVGSNQVGRWLAPRVTPIWLAPIMAACFACYLLVQLLREVRGAAAVCPLSPGEPNAPGL